MGEHTPTPWFSEEVRTLVGRCFKIGSPEMTNTRGKPQYVCVYDDWGHGDNVQSANAAFIVEACNNFDRMRSALLLVRKYMQEEVDEIGVELLTAENRAIWDAVENALKESTDAK
jgi:hypothetical protein